MLTPAFPPLWDFCGRRGSRMCSHPVLPGRGRKLLPFMLWLGSRSGQQLRLYNGSTRKVSVSRNWTLSRYHKLSPLWVPRARTLCRWGLVGDVARSTQVGVWSGSGPHPLAGCREGAQGCSRAAATLIKPCLATEGNLSLQASCSPVWEVQEGVCSLPVVQTHF